MPQIAPKLDERDSLLEQIRTKVRASTLFLSADRTLFIFNASVDLKILVGSLSPST